MADKVSRFTCSKKTLTTFSVKYSVAIRTLGTSGNLLKRELESLHKQTIRPQRVIIYIAQGYRIPDYRVADEIYVPVTKGMVAQAALDYREIDSDLILKLDDDVEFTSPTDVESLINALCLNNYDCVVADTFCNHKMPLSEKIKAALTGLVFPRFNQKWAFKIHANGAFSYINNPTQDIYPSQSGAGPCSLWYKSVLTGLDLKSELWLDSLGFAFGDDQVVFQKLVRNGGKLATLFHSGIVHNDGKSSSIAYHRNVNKFRTRAKGQYLVWHRSVFSAQRNGFGRMWCCLSFGLKVLWLFPVHCVAAMRFRSIRIPLLFVKGTIEGMQFTKTKQYKSLPPFCLR